MDIVSPWNLQELLVDVYPAALHFFDVSSCRVDTLVDVSKMTSIPSGVLRARQSPFLSHPRSGYQVVVGANVYAQRMAEILFHLTQFKRVRFFTRMDDAWAFLHSTELQQEPVVGVKAAE